MAVQTTGSGLGGTPETPVPVPQAPTPLAPDSLSKLEAQAAEGQASAPVKTTGSKDKTTPSAGQGLPSINPASTVLSLPKQESTQTDVDNYLKQYVSELSNLGPEYTAEMQYLQPYLAPSSGLSTEQAVAKSISPDAISPNNNSPANQAINTAGAQLAQAVNAQTPAIAGAFDKEASQMEQYGKTVPYSDVLTSILGAGKNELLYGSTPFFSSVATTGWSPEMSSLYAYLSGGASTTELGNPNLPGAASAASSTGTGTVPGITSAGASPGVGNAG